MNEDSAVVMVLKAFVPYTRENLLLSFKPGKFFAELERASGRSRQSIKQGYYRARRAGLISDDPIPRLTAKGRTIVAPFTATKLERGARLMIIFDVPEYSANTRHRLRRLLKNLEFQQVQKSVWVTDCDHRDTIREAIQELELTDCVEVYECARL